MLLVNGTVRHIIVFYGFTFSGKVRLTVNVECLAWPKNKKKRGKTYNKKKRKKLFKSYFGFSVLLVTRHLYIVCGSVCAWCVSVREWWCEWVLEVFAGGGCDWLAAVHSDTQVFGVVLVGLLGLRQGGWTAAVGLHRAVVLPHLGRYKIVVVLFVLRVVPSRAPDRGDVSSQAAGSVQRRGRGVSAGVAPLPHRPLGRAPPQQRAVLLEGWIRVGGAHPGQEGVSEGVSLATGGHVPQQAVPLVGSLHGGRSHQQTVLPVQLLVPAQRRLPVQAAHERRLPEDAVLQTEARFGTPGRLHQCGPAPGGLLVAAARSLWGGVAAVGVRGAGLASGGGVLPRAVGRPVAAGGAAALRRRVLTAASVGGAALSSSSAIAAVQCVLGAARPAVPLARWAAAAAVVPTGMLAVAFTPLVVLLLRQLVLLRGLPPLGVSLAGFLVGGTVVGMVVFAGAGAGRLLLAAGWYFGFWWVARLRWRVGRGPGAHFRSVL